MRNARLQLHGLREMQAALRALPDEIEDAAVVQALKEAGEPMRQGMADLAPRRRSAESLADNIVISEKLSDSGKQTAPRDGKEEAYVYVGPDMEKPGYAPHGHLAEFGTGPRYHESGKSTGSMPAQPFVRPAFDAFKGVVARAFGPKMWEIVKAAAKKVRVR